MREASGGMHYLLWSGFIILRSRGNLSAGKDSCFALLLSNLVQGSASYVLYKCRALMVSINLVNVIDSICKSLFLSSMKKFIAFYSFQRFVYTKLLNILGMARRPDEVLRIFNFMRVRTFGLLRCEI